MSFFVDLANSLPSALAQGLIWGIMAVGVFITYRILGVADLTVDGTLALGGAVCVTLIRAGCNAYLAVAVAIVAGLLAGLITGFLHTTCGIPVIFAGNISPLGPFFLTFCVFVRGAKPSASVGI